MACFLTAVIWPSTIYAQSSYTGQTIFLGFGLSLTSAGNALNFPSYTPNSYSKCFSNTNTVKAEPNMPTGLSIYVQQAKRVRIRYDLITEDGVTVRTAEYESGEYEWPTYVTGTNINNIGNEIFSHTPVDDRDYYFKITVRAGKKIGLFSGLNWSTVLGTYYTLPAEVDYEDANPEFTLTSQTTTVNGIPVSCSGDVRINGSASTCETVYYLEVTETDQWWNHAYPQAHFAGKWFTGTVPSNIDLQWFCNNYGNPLPTTVSPVSGQIPSSYGGFQMQERPYPGNGTPNFYRIKLVTFQNAWKEKNMLIDVYTCKTGSPSIAFDPSTLVPMTQAELDALFQRHGNPLVDESLLLDNSLEPSVNLYPNPAKDYCTITATELVQIENIQIMDLYGNSFECPTNERVVNSIELNTSILKSGLYIIVVQIGDKLIRKKLWIQ